MPPSIDIRTRTNLPLQIFQINYGISLILHYQQENQIIQ